jgi:hypothetical protein
MRGIKNGESISGLIREKPAPVPESGLFKKRAESKKAPL